MVAAGGGGQKGGVGLLVGNSGLTHLVVFCEGNASAMAKGRGGGWQFCG